MANPAFAEKVNVAVKRAAAAHELKSMVTGAVPSWATARSPTNKGKAEEFVTTGVQAAPAVCVREKELMVVPKAAAGPLFWTESVQTRASGVPVLEVMLPKRLVDAVEIAAKFAVMIWSVDMTTVVKGLKGRVAAPVQDAKV